LRLSAPRYETDLTAQIASLASQVYCLSAAIRRKDGNAPLDRVILMLDSIACLAAPTVQQIYWCGRTALCRSKDDFPTYDECFFSIFEGSIQFNVDQGTHSVPPTHVAALGPDLSTEGDHNLAAIDGKQRTAEAAFRTAASDGSDGREEALVKRIGSAGASESDVLRHRDATQLSEQEQGALYELIEKFVSRQPRRISRRSRSSSRGSIDVHRTVRSALSQDGDPARIYLLRPNVRFRRLILLLDVSGSMARYAEVLLRLGYALVRAWPRGVEVFTLGTRLTRITRPMHESRADTALSRVSSAIPDWQGGTQLGDRLKTFLDEWGQRGMARGADILIASDGLERGDCAVLAEQMARLKRLARRVIWCNPHKSTDGYEPIARGMRAAMPYIDEFVAGRTLAEIEGIAKKLGERFDARSVRRGVKVEGPIVEQIKTDSRMV
jgi:uncharacterized protein